MRQVLVWSFLCAAGLLCGDGVAFSREAGIPGGTLTLKDAIATAKSRFAEVEAQRADLSAAEEGVGLAKKAYLPDGEIYLQWNRATRNNVFGLLLPSGSVPSISGPALPDKTAESTYGSVAAALVRWKALDFGVRAAGVREAEALRNRALMGLRLTELQVSLGATEAFLSVVAAESTVRAAAATAERMEAFERAVSVLAANQLRAGADLSLARAGLARARTELAQAEGDLGEARTRLSEWLGAVAPGVEVEGTELITSAPETAHDPGAAPESHPLVAQARAEIDAAEARRDAASRAALPEIDLVGSVYSRGTGALLDGTFEGGGAGLWPDRSNWGIGVSVRFPILDLPEARQRKAIEAHRARAAMARYENARQHLAGDLERARIRLATARRIAENTPLELDAARALQAQARARYDAGLADVLEVAESERILRRAETEDVMARLDVWRARFALAAVEGDLSGVLSQLD